MGRGASLCARGTLQATDAGYGQVHHTEEETMADEQPPVTTVKQPLTDDSIRVRQLSHYQFSWVAGEAGQDGTWTLQLVLDQGAWEEVLTISGEDADNLQDLLSTAKVVHFDVGRRVLLFGTTPVGSA
jgi:hypothetical protein